MKKILLLLTAFTMLVFIACKRTNWADGILSAVISVEDIRLLYKGEDLVLNNTNMSGATKITGIVISDASSGNLQEGMLVLQQNRRKKIRGINLIVGNQANNFKPGDSIIVDINGAILTKEEGSLKIKDIATNAIQLVSESNVLESKIISIAQLKSNSSNYESTLVKVYAGDFVPEPISGDSYSGDRVLSDGTGQMVLHTEVTASYAMVQLPATVSVTGIALMYLPVGAAEPEISLWPRNIKDIKAKTVILAWNLLGAIGNEAISNSTITNPNLETSTLSRGVGLAVQTAGGSYASTFSINADKAAAITAGSYYQFTIKPKGISKISLSALDIILRIQTNAPKTYIWMYSMDGGISFKDIGEPYTWVTGFSENNGIQQPQLDLSMIDDLQTLTSVTPVMFRLYAWGGTSVSSNNGVRIGKSLTVAQHALAIEGTVEEF
ncbi:DUF5689 domain-containing protein [Pedobacter arcticus]|uniref:DUF5689 domain-containing protein n=1 Tax=Pedobacter arcticus TaxID=752140 RepID=UPI00037DAE14|nr:DUF5689 domain-containing protein [Pedobacter arcticus]